MLGDELRKARQAAGRTQEELSFEAGLHRTYISQLEHDKKSPTLDVLFRICDALGTPASRRIARVEKKRNPPACRHQRLRQRDGPGRADQTWRGPGKTQPASHSRPPA